MHKIHSSVSLTPLSELSGWSIPLPLSLLFRHEVDFLYGSSSSSTLYYIHFQKDSDAVLPGKTTAPQGGKIFRSTIRSVPSKRGLSTCAVLFVYHLFPELNPILVSQFRRSHGLSCKRGNWEKYIKMKKKKLSDNRNSSSK